MYIFVIKILFLFLNASICIAWQASFIIIKQGSIYWVEFFLDMSGECKVICCMTYQVANTCSLKTNSCEKNMGWPNPTDKPFYPTHF